jgi:hypothetical protein
VHGVGAGVARRLQNALDVQVTLARRIGTDRPGLVRETDVKGRPIAFRIDRYRGYAHFAACANDAHSDFAAIGDENLVQLRELSGWPDYFTG